MSQRHIDFGATEIEPLVGEVTVLRTFAVGDDGSLLPVAQQDMGAWQDGENTAQCAGHAHAAPDEDCTCGFYAYGHERWIDHDSYTQFEHVMAAVDCYGKIVAGEKGVRAEKACIVGVWLSPSVPQSVVGMIRSRYPSTAFYGSKTALRRAHPPTRLDTYMPDDGGEGFILARGVEFLSRSRWGSAAVGAALGVSAFLPTEWGLAVASVWGLVLSLTLIGCAMLVRRGHSLGRRGLLALTRFTSLLVGPLVTFACLSVVVLEAMGVRREGSLLSPAASLGVGLLCMLGGVFLWWVGWRNARPSFQVVRGLAGFRVVAEAGAGEMVEVPGMGGVMEVPHPQTGHHHRTLVRVYHGTNHGRLLTIQGIPLTPEDAPLRSLAASVHSLIEDHRNTLGVLVIFGPLSVLVPFAEGEPQSASMAMATGRAMRALSIPVRDWVPTNTLVAVLSGMQFPTSYTSLESADRHVRAAVTDARRRLAHTFAQSEERELAEACIPAHDSPWGKGIDFLNEADVDEDDVVEGWARLFASDSARVRDDALSLFCRVRAYLPLTIRHRVSRIVEGQQAD